MARPTPSTALNAAAAGGQMLVAGIVLLVQYAFLWRTVGARDIGAWAIVTALVSGVSSAGLGLGASVTKFIAQYRARQDEQYVATLIETAALTVATATGGALLLLHPLLTRILHYLLADGASLGLAEQLLPATMLSFWLTSLAAVLTGSLDGAHQIAQRALMTSLAQVLFLGLSLAWVPQAGIIGVVHAQVVQQAVLTLGTWVLLRRAVPMLGAVPRRWSFRALREMFSYGAHFQVISISVLLLEPVTKALLTRFGSLSLVGSYELANRAVFFLRSSIISIQQTLVPAVAHRTELAPESVDAIYQRTAQLAALLVATSLPLLLLLLPSVAEAWLGAHTGEFTAYASILAISWFLNLLAGPAFFVFLGRGEPRWNTLSHVVMGLANAGLGLLLGWLLGGIGVVIGTASAIIIGSAIIVVAYHLRYGIAASALFPAGLRRLAAGGIAIALVLRVAEPMLLTSVPGALRAPLVGLAFLALMFPLARREPSLADLGQQVQRVARMALRRDGLPLPPR